MGEWVLAAFGVFTLLGLLLLAIGVMTKRRWATHIGLTCLLSLAAAWVLGVYAFLVGILAGTLAWFLRPVPQGREP